MSAPDWSAFQTFMRDKWRNDKINEQSRPPDNAGEPRYNDPTYQFNRHLQGNAFQKYVAEWHYGGHTEFGLLTQDPGRSHINGFAEDYACSKTADGTVWSMDVVSAMGTNWSGINGGQPTREARQQAFAVPPRVGPVTPPPDVPPVTPPPAPGEEPWIKPLEELILTVSKLVTRIKKLEDAPPPDGSGLTEAQVKELLREARVEITMESAGAGTFSRGHVHPATGRIKP